MAAAGAAADEAMSADVPVAGRAPLLVLAFASLFAGMAAGLARLGWPFPAPVAELAALHGPLMACGFFGTVISLERAVALSRRWALLSRRCWRGWAQRRVSSARRSPPLPSSSRWAAR